jgi:hypothetical protein
MSRTECAREQEVLDVITSGRWPDKLGDELSVHVANCTICSDLGLVAETFSADYQSALQDVRVPSAGLVWWRAEIRSRQAAVRAVNRPISWAQYLAAACGVAAVVLIFRFVDLSLLSAFRLDMLRDLLPLPVIYLLLGALAIVLSLAAYLVLSDD